MGQTHTITCDECGAQYAVDLDVCSVCGTANISIDQAFYDLLVVVDDVSTDEFNARPKTMEVGDDDIEMLERAGMLPDNMLESSPGMVEYRTDEFDAIVVPEPPTKKIAALQEDLTPRKGVLVAETIAQAFYEKTTVSGGVAPVEKSNQRRATPPPIPDDFENAWDAISRSIETDDD